MKKIRVASRKSALALTQTHLIIRTLQTYHPHLSFEVLPIVTRGDRILDVSLSKVGGKGLFVSEIEESLLSHEADFAVHSLKDVPSVLANGLVLSATPKREDPRDAVISRFGKPFTALPQGARVGTSSLRRMAQLKRLRPDILIEPLRGNIDTRLKKLESEGLDAIVLAAAGLHRMGWQNRITEYLDVNQSIPAICQGILGIECRAEDSETRVLLSVLNHAQTMSIARAERALLFALNGGCQVPIAGYASYPEAGGPAHLRGLVASVDGTTILTAEDVGVEMEVLGQSVAQQLYDQGASSLLVDPDAV